MGVIKKFPSLEAHFLADAGLPAPSPAALSGGLRCFLRPSRHTSPWTSRRGSDQVPHTHQIVGGRCPGKHPGDTLPAPVPYLAHQSYRLHPPKDFGKNIFDESWIKGAQSSPIQGSEGADDHETHDYH